MKYLGQTSNDKDIVTKDKLAYEIVETLPQNGEIGKVVYEKTTTPSYTFSLTKSAYTDGTEGQKWYASYSYTAETYTQYSFSDGESTWVSETTFSSSLSPHTEVTIEDVTYDIIVSDNTITLSHLSDTYSGTSSITIGDVTYTITTSTQTSDVAGKHTIEYNFWSVDFGTGSTGVVDYDLNLTNYTQNVSYLSSVTDNMVGGVNPTIYITHVLGLGGYGKIKVYIKDNNNLYSSFKINSIVIDSKTVYENGEPDSLHVQNLKISDGTSFKDLYKLLGLDYTIVDGVMNINLTNGG